MTGFKKGTRTQHFFHKSMQARHNRSYISSLVTSDGTNLTSSQAISREAIQFYSALFSDDLPPKKIEENTILSCIPSIVTREMNDSLMRPISMSNLEGVVSSLLKGKALGPDGFPAEFF